MNFRDLGKKKRYDVYPELLDIHVERMKTAHRVVNTYMKESELLESGLLGAVNFVGAESAERIAAEIDKVPPKDGKTLESTVFTMKGSESLKAMEWIWGILKTIFQEKTHNEVFSAFMHHSYLQHLHNCPDDKDEQKVFHSDTFFPCVKFWYFPREVKKEDGAFWYVPYSTVLTEKLLDWHEARVKDLKEGKSEEWRGAGHREGSFRISEEEIEGLGLKPMPVEVGPDTLLLGNVFGFHRRGDTLKPTDRLSIHGSIRFNNPFAWA